MNAHPSHQLRSSDASSFDVVCENCGATDKACALLAAPCPQAPATTHPSHRLLDVSDLSLTQDVLCADCKAEDGSTAGRTLLAAPCLAEPAVQVAHDRSDGRQKAALAWAVETYGARARGRRYQAFRMLEEACELAQAQGLTFKDMLRVASYVDDRPAGDTPTEVGDLRLCLDILAENLGLSVVAVSLKKLMLEKGLDDERC